MHEDAFTGCAVFGPAVLFLAGCGVFWLNILHASLTVGLYGRFGLLGPHAHEIFWAVGLYGTIWFAGPHVKNEKQLKQHFFEIIFIRVGSNSLSGDMWPPFDSSYDFLHGGPQEKKARIFQPEQKSGAFS